MSKITKLSYRALFNLGDYENEAIELHATLEEGDDLESVVESLRQKTVELTQSNIQDGWEKRRQLRREVEDLENKVLKARADWEATTEFLRTQGIKTDTPAFPTLLKMLPQARSEEVVDAEIDDDIRF